MLDEVASPPCPPAEDADVDLFLSPGPIDLQVNGFAGIHFGDPELTEEGVLSVARALWASGTTHFLPTLITDSVPRMREAVSRIQSAAEQAALHGAILGIHLEGPYLSSLDGPRGAHPLQHCKDPDWEEFQSLQDAASGLIRLVTLAPERGGALPFIEKVVATGVRVAIGHTAANRQTMLAAIAAGATLSTHLGNAAHDQLQRHHNYVYDQLGEDRLAASLIVDGHHLPPHLVKIFWRAKGPERTILISDAVQYAGLPPGTYDAGYRRFEVRADGFIGVVGEPRLAGSGLLLLRGVENLIRFTGAELGAAFATVTVNPARFLGLEQRLGELAPGREASLVRFRWDRQTGKVTVVETIVGGQTVYEAEGMAGAPISSANKQAATGVE